VNIDCFVLSLKESIERRINIDRELKRNGIKYSIIDGIDGRNENIERDVSSMLTCSEAACAYGHLKIYKLFIKSKNDLLLVFEDDVSINLPVMPIIVKIAQKYEQGKLGKGIVVLLGGQEGILSHKIYCIKQKFDNVENNVSIFKILNKANFVYRTCCYIIDRTAAENIIALNDKIIYKADEWNYFYKHGAIANIYLISKGVVVHPKMLGSSLIEKDRNNGQYNINKVLIVTVAKRLLGNLMLRVKYFLGSHE
jgi:glycosyl transferase family 25